MKKIILGLLLLLSLTLRGCGTAHAAASHVPHWTRCVYSVQHGVITSAACHSHAMPKHAGERVTGHRSSINWDTLRYGYYAVTRIPRFYVAPKVPPSPPGLTVTLYITGYSYGSSCGDINGVTADGSPAQVGDVSSDNPAYWHHHVYVPSLGYYGFVNDRGVGTGGLDLFAPSCSDTYAYTGWRTVVIYP